MVLLLDIMQHRDDLIYGLCVLEELTRAGVKLIPSLEAFYNSDKFSNYLLWRRHLQKIVNMPESLCSINLDESLAFLRKHKQVIFKPISGTMGIGIEVLDTENRLKELLEKFHALFLQEIIPDRGYDIRTLVIGSRQVFQYVRYNPQQLRKNIHLGAVPKSIEAMEELDPETTRFAAISRDIAVEVQKVAGTEIIGVDTIPSKDGQIYLLEWNSVPGLRGAEDATKVNIAKEIVKILFLD